MSEILNRQLYRKLISLFLSSLETFNFLTLWISSVMPPVLTPSSCLKDQRDKRYPSPRVTRLSREIEQQRSSSHDALFSILRNCNPLENDDNYFQNFVNSGLKTEQAVAKLRMDRKLPTSAETYSYLQSVWENNNMQNFSDFLKR